MDDQKFIDDLNRLCDLYEKEVADLRAQLAEKDAADTEMRRLLAEENDDLRERLAAAEYNFKQIKKLHDQTLELVKEQCERAEKAERKLEALAGLEE